MNYAGQASDPATFEIVKNSFYKIAEEMRVVLAKTAYSPLLKSAGDYSCGVFDAQGEMVAQGPDLPIHLGSMPDAVRAVVAAFAADVHDGDVFLHNDPYFGGSHLPDVNVVRPAFHEGRLLGYACLRAHWPDVGSATPGSYGAVTEIFGEGLRLPPLRLFNRGALNVDLEKIILANVRTPDERKGDLGAQLAATLRATVRLKALAERYGSGAVIGYMAQVMDYSDRLMRAALTDLPDGEGAFEDFCDGDGIADDDQGRDAQFRIRLSVKKTGDRLIVDFAGTDPQVKGPMNAPLSVTASGIFCGLKTAVDPNNLIPPNSGCWRSIEIRARKGSVVNAEFPAPVVYANHEMSHRVADMVMGALASFLPRQVMACSQGTSAILTLGGVDPRSGRHYVSYETVKGGYGARPNKDGINCIASGISNTMNTPVEIMETAFPVRVERYEVNPDSGGPGRYRGGCGARRVWRMLDGADATGALCMERMTSPPFGLLGGKAGAAAVVTLTTPDGVTRDLPSKGAFAAPAGSVIDMITPGSGGFGPVAERDPAAIGRDLLDGYVSAAAAEARLRRRRSGGAAQGGRIGGQQRDLHPEFDRGARRREPGAHADQPAPAPAGGPAGDRPRRGLPRVRRCRPRLHRGDRRAVVRIARLRLRAARQGRLRADAQARLLPPLPPPLERAGDRAGREAARDRAGADGPRRLPMLGLGGERHRHQARLVLLGRGRQAAAHARSSPAAWPITATPARRSASPASRTCTPASACRSRPFKHTEFPHYYRRHEPGESETAFSTRMAQALDALIQAEGPDTIAAFFAEPVMGAGGAIVPPEGYFEQDPGGAAQIRHPVCRRRGDLRLCAHRRDVGLADLRHPARHGDLGQGAVRRHAADLGRAHQRPHPRGDARAVGQVRQLRPWLHLCGPSGGGRGRARGAEDLRRDGHRRPAPSAWAPCCSRGSAGSRRIRWSATCAAPASSSAWS